MTYLNQAKALGDVLIVGVNSDESVARLKGHGRPINSLDDRIQVLSALSCVDLIVPFADDTPVRLIETVRPDVFVKGGDYTKADLPEAATVERLGGLVRLLPFIEDRSTTQIIERICRMRNGLLTNDASPSGRDRRARETDAGSVNSSAICATEDTLSRRPARSGGRGCSSGGEWPPDE